MKKMMIAAILSTLIAPFASAQITPAGDASYSGYLANEKALSYNKTYQIDMGAYDGSRVSAQVISYSTIIPSFTFQDGSQSTFSVTISSYYALTGNTLTIGSVVLTGGSNFAIGANNGAAATNVAAAIVSAGLGYTAGATGSIVYATSTLNGSQYNYSLYSSTPTAMAVSAAKAVNGSNPAFVLGGQLFSAGAVTNATLALPLLYTKGTQDIGGLTDQTTYYAVPIGSQALYLAKYSTSAIAGLSRDYVTVTSTNTQLLTSIHTYTLGESGGVVGSTSYSWQVSDDGSYWNASVSTGTCVIGSYSGPPSSLSVDFGSFNYRYLRLNVTAPTNGGVFLQVPVNIKQDGIGRF